MASEVLAVNLLSPHSLLSSFGAIGVFVVLFAETGLLIGIFLPGDSLLFTAGLLCSTKVQSSLHLSLPAVLLAAAAGALLGAEAGYLIGHRVGPALVAEGRPRLRAAVDQAREFLDRYGPAKAVVLGRFIPFVRTVINPLAGILRVSHRTFLLSQVVGGLAWSVGVTCAGYLLGTRIPSIDKYLLPIIAVVVILSLIPVLLELRRSRRNGRVRG
ncbi:MAG TPA: DedA family protein [Jatrophihabitans sp.]|nr:DedA family protein [Jatrophihabitans sp.]